MYVCITHTYIRNVDTYIYFISGSDCRSNLEGGYVRGFDISKQSDVEQLVLMYVCAPFCLHTA